MYYTDMCNDVGQVELESMIEYNILHLRPCHVQILIPLLIILKLF